MSDVGHPFVWMHSLSEQVRSCLTEGFDVKLSLTWWWHLLSLGQELCLGFALGNVTSIPDPICEARSAWGGKVTLFFQKMLERELDSVILKGHSNLSYPMVSLIIPFAISFGL